MSTLDDRLPALAARLHRLVPPETSSGSWEDVVRRTRRPLRRRGTAWVKVVVAVVLFLLFAGIATGTYLVLHNSSGVQQKLKPRPAVLTVPAGGATGAAELDEVLPGGKTRVVWNCPGNVFCGEWTSVDWAPDGRHVAFTLDEIGGTSQYVGLHILDLRTGHDIHVPLFDPPVPPISPLGCDPTDLAWSSDSRRLAYACSTLFGNGITGLFTVRSDGTDRRHLNIELATTGWPSWSPDGKRIAFSGATAGSSISSIYVIGIDGTHRVLIARHGTAPDWSPDGKLIAYGAPDGVRFVTPDGDVTPATVEPRGVPAWSPDGSSLAIGTRAGVYVLRLPAGTADRATKSGWGVFGAIRPAWYPGKSVPRTRRTQEVVRHCKTCF